MNPLAPPSDAVFDREVTCVRKGTGFTGCTGYLHGYLHVTEPGAKGGERTPERNGSGGRTTGRNQSSARSPEMLPWRLALVKSLPIWKMAMVRFKNQRQWVPPRLCDSGLSEQWASPPRVACRGLVHCCHYIQIVSFTSDAKES